MRSAAMQRRRPSGAWKPTAGPSNSSPSYRWDDTCNPPVPEMPPRIATVRALGRAASDRQLLDQELAANHRIAIRHRDAVDARRVVEAALPALLGHRRDTVLGEDQRLDEIPSFERLAGIDIRVPRNECVDSELGRGAVLRQCLDQRVPD